MNEHNDAHSRLHLVSRNHLIVVYPTNPQFSVADIPSQRLRIFLFQKRLNRYPRWPNFHHHFPSNLLKRVDLSGYQSHPQWHGQHFSLQLVLYI